MSWYESSDLSLGLVRCTGFCRPSPVYLSLRLGFSYQLVREIVRLREQPTQRRPRLVQSTDQDPVFSNTRCLRQDRNTARLPAPTPTGQLHTAHLPTGNMCHLPGRVERSIPRMGPARRSTAKLLTKEEARKSPANIAKLPERRFSWRGLVEFGCRTQNDGGCRSPHLSASVMAVSGGGHRSSIARNTYRCRRL